MYSYTFVQWLLFFYTYCFLGWLWETAYVSVKKHSFTNRGFMAGPFLPIYGSGAIIVLLATIPVKHNLVLVFVLGLIAATTLEYVTGVTMESLFKVRYWDYSHRPLNVKGHICLECSIGWGVFSVLMIQVIHRPIEEVVFKIPYTIQEVSACLLSMGISVDLGCAVRDALDLKEMLIRIRENNDELVRMQKRMDVLIAVWDDEKKIMKERLEQFMMSHKEEKGYLGRTLDSLKARMDILDMAKQKTENIYSEHYKEFIEELDGIKEKFTVSKLKMELRTKKVTHHMKGLLRRNPDAVSIDYEEALQEIKSMNDKEEE